MISKKRISKCLAQKLLPKESQRSEGTNANVLLQLTCPTFDIDVLNTKLSALSPMESQKISVQIA